MSNIEFDEDIDYVNTIYGIFAEGDRIEVVITNEDWGYYAEEEDYPADEGHVVGFAEIPGSQHGPARTAIYVEFEDSVLEVKPSDMLVLA